MYVLKPSPLTFYSASEGENDAPLWASGTNYGLGAQVIRDHKVYVSSIDDNIGLDPALEVQQLKGARWILFGSTNIYRWLDGELSTQTESSSTTLVLEATVGAGYNAIGLLNLRCQHCKIERILGSTVTVIGEFFSGAVPVDNWLDWLNSQFVNTERRKLISASGGAGSRVRLTIVGPDPALGQLVVGQEVRIGRTLYDSETVMRRRSFSTIDRNEFGQTNSIKRRIASDVTYKIHAINDRFHRINNFLDSVDGIPILSYTMKTGHQHLINYGYLIDYELPCDLPNDFVFSITVQGVT